MKYVLMFFALNADGVPALTAQEFDTKAACDREEYKVRKAYLDGYEKFKADHRFFRSWCAPKG